MMTFAEHCRARLQHRAGERFPEFYLHYCRLPADRPGSVRRPREWVSDWAAIEATARAIGLPDDVVEEGRALFDDWRNPMEQRGGRTRRARRQA